MFFSVCHIGRTKKQILINELQKCKDEKRKYFPSWIFFYCLRFDKIAANNLKIQQGVKYCLTIQINLVDDMIFLIRSLFDIWSRGFRFIRKQLIEKIKIHTKFDLFKRKQNREIKKKNDFVLTQELHSSITNRIFVGKLLHYLNSLRFCDLHLILFTLNMRENRQQKVISFLFLFFYNQ